MIGEMKCSVGMFQVAESYKNVVENYYSSTIKSATATELIEVRAASGVLSSVVLVFDQYQKYSTRHQYHQDKSPLTS